MKQIRFESFRQIFRNKVVCANIGLKNNGIWNFRFEIWNTKKCEVFRQILNEKITRKGKAKQILKKSLVRCIFGFK